MFFCYNIYSQPENVCPNKINIGDTTIHSDVDMNISLCAENIADYYLWSNEDTTQCSNFTFLLNQNNQITMQSFSIANSSNLVYNGDFELGNVGFETDYTYNSHSFGTVNGFTQGNFCIVTNPRNINHYFANCPNTNNMLVFDAGTACTYMYAYKTTAYSISPDSYYLVSYQLRALNANQVEYEKPIIETIINDSSYGTVAAEDNNCTWQTISYTWYSDSNTYRNLKLLNQNTEAGGNDFGLDNISIRKRCVAEDTVNITVVSVYMNIDTVEVSICEDELPFEYKYRGVQCNNGGTYTFEAADTLFYIIINTYPVYNDTVFADICEGEIYMNYGFH